jgi:hypothetical protein
MRFFTVVSMPRTAKWKYDSSISSPTDTTRQTPAFLLLHVLLFKFLINFYMQLMIGLQFFQFGRSIDTLGFRDVSQGFQNPRHHTFETTKVNDSPLIELGKEFIDTRRQHILHV